MNTQLSSPEVMQVLTLGSEKHWGFRVMKDRGVMEEETYKNGLWFIPTDSTQIQRGRNRLEAIQKVARVKQVIVAHEAPLLLTASQVTHKPNNPVAHKLKISGRGVVIGLCASTGLLVTILAATMLVVLVGAVVASVLAIAGTALAIAPFFLLLSVGLLIDPCLIVVLEDGTRIEVMTWIE